MDNLRAQYAKNAAQLAAMLASGKYRGLRREQVQAAHDNAAQCAVMTDAELRAYLADGRSRVAARLSAMESK